MLLADPMRDQTIFWIPRLPVPWGTPSGDEERQKASMGVSPHALIFDFAKERAARSIPFFNLTFVTLLT